MEWAAVGEIDITVLLVKCRQMKFEADPRKNNVLVSVNENSDCWSGVFGP